MPGDPTSLCSQLEVRVCDVDEPGEYEHAQPSRSSNGRQPPQWVPELACHHVPGDPGSLRGQAQAGDGGEPGGSEHAHHDRQQQVSNLCMITEQ